MAALAPRDGECVVTRFHGLTPFHGTELDQLLRNLGVRTVVATGVSVNIGILGLTIEAVNAGYQVVIPREAVTGTPGRVRRRRHGPHAAAARDACTRGRRRSSVAADGNATLRAARSYS